MPRELEVLVDILTDSFEGSSISDYTTSYSGTKVLGKERDGRTKTFIPDIYIPSDANGNLVEPNPFDNRYIQYNQDMSENVNNKIQTEQATIQHTAYQASYYATFERIISGVWSPATFGSDMKKTDNADAQKEKEISRRHQTP